jgi:Flp pilus assembly protein TadG
MGISVFRANRSLRDDCRGTSALEFAFVAPVLFLILLGIIQFGLTINNYEMLTNGTQAAARQFSLSRGSTTPSSSATSAMYNAAPTLAQAQITLSLVVNGTQCSTGGTAGDAACQTALTAAQGKAATVTGSYPCSLAFYGYDFAPNCLLTSTVTESVE